jgi:hypothetical protein
VTHTLRVARQRQLDSHGCACRLDELSPATALPHRSNRAGKELQANSSRSGSMQRLGAIDPPLLRFLVPSAHIGHGACLLFEGRQPSNARLGTFQYGRCCSNRRTRWGGSFGGVSSHRDDVTPIVFRPSAQVRIGETDLIVTLAESPTCSSDAVWISCRPAASCTIANFVGEVFRYALFPDIHGLAGQSNSSFLVSRPAALLGSMLCPAQVCSRGWVERAFLPPRAHVSLRRPASNPIYFVRADRSPALESYFKGRSAEDLDFGVALDFWALTPICDPHPPARYGPANRSCLGLCLLQGSRARVCAADRARPRFGSSTSRIPRPAFHCGSRAIPIRSWD